MKRFTMKSAIVAAVLMIALPSQATVTIEQVNGQWLNSTSGSPSLVEFYSTSSTYGNTAQRQVLWGIPQNSTEKSGLGFTGVASPDKYVDMDHPFDIGQLIHYNREVDIQSACTAVQLLLEMSFVEGPTVAMILELCIDETANAPGPPLSNDIITFPVANPADLIHIAGTSYILQIVGFGSEFDDLTHTINTREGQQSTSYIWATLTPVPEPATIAMLALGSLAIIRRRKK